MVVVRSLKDIISIKIKPRHDSPCDQFSRIFMTKMLLIASVVMGFQYFSDKINCLQAHKSDVSKDFVHAACWISGLYVYKERKLVENQIYPGIPSNLKMDGFTSESYHPCDSTSASNMGVGMCTKLTREYYLHYQWMPFYIGALAIFYYLPYVLFRIINVDLISLKSVLESVTGDADHIVRNYFNYKINSIGKLRMRIFLNVIVKCAYVIANLFGFFFTDYLLNGNYRNYGFDYMDWARDSTDENHIGLRYRRRIEKPGNKLLPSMGMCDVEESATNLGATAHNSHSFVCEMSTHVLYQYVLLVMWFLFVVSISISIIGCLSQVLGYFLHFMFGQFGSTPKKTILRVITLREAEYLKFIKSKNMVMYGEVLRKLKQHRSDLQGKIAHEDFETSNGFV
ncbi:innexin inx2-like [Clytia hemisphaerica]|uniref:innexin inx2-like n=1 Tax=Clytia hemisphaerica TaxID=252671 RepID=UPI0034D6F775